MLLLSKQVLSIFLVLVRQKSPLKGSRTDELIKQFPAWFSRGSYIIRSTVANNKEIGAFIILYHGLLGIVEKFEDC